MCDINAQKAELKDKDSNIRVAIDKFIMVLVGVALKVSDITFILVPVIFWHVFKTVVGDAFRSRTSSTDDHCPLGEGCHKTLKLALVRISWIWHEWSNLN